MQKQLTLLILVIGYINCTNITNWVSIGSALISRLPCNGTNEISVTYESDQPPEKENSYEVYISIMFPRYSIVTVMLDSEGSIKLSSKSFARIFASYNNSFTIQFFKAHDGLSFMVQGNRIGTVPYIISLEINSQEYCSKPFLGFLDDFVTGYRDYAESDNRKLEGNCGRRKVTHTELIVNGASTKAGDWPWHTAIYRLKKSVIKYICGGTLISKYIVLTGLLSSNVMQNCHTILGATTENGITMVLRLIISIHAAAHCTSIRGVPVLPEVLSVILGKFNLIGGDTGSQEREIRQIIVHDHFENRLLNNDIALLKLNTEAIFSDYIQPACLWYTKANEKLSSEIMGTVVGWGFDNTNTLAHQLRQANMPLIAEVVCIRSNPVFYSKVLNENKFCAGYHNGTSACNGDSGGAFQVFIPDNAQDESPHAAGAWYVRGIVSLTLSRTDEPVCDPTQYVVFTDVEKYRSWIENHAGLI